MQGSLELHQNQAASKFETNVCDRSFTAILLFLFEKNSLFLAKQSTPSVPLGIPERSNHFCLVKNVCPHSSLQLQGIQQLWGHSWNKSCPVTSSLKHPCPVVQLQWHSGESIITEQFSTLVSLQLCNQITEMQNTTQHNYLSHFCLLFIAPHSSLTLVQYLALKLSPKRFM